MNSPALTEALLRMEREGLPSLGDMPIRKEAGEGGCGVVGAAASVPISGDVFLQSLRQMANRGNGKGGGVAVSGLDPSFFGVTEEQIRGDYLLAIAYLDPTAREEVEREFIEPKFEVDHTFDVPAAEGEVSGVRPPDVRIYFVRLRDDVRKQIGSIEAPDAAGAAGEDELVWINSYALNAKFYASTGEKRAFVLSHAKDLLVLKLVGYGDDVIRHYQLEGLRANVWIGHHRYPTKGTVWHPGGAHPFIGMHEALVHNGDFANYASICSYLRQVGRQPQFLTDTEVAVLVFDLLNRIYGYPLEYVIEALAPTTERDFSLLPEDKRRVYDLIAKTHIHGSPDGPWFFLIAQSVPQDSSRRLIGITDTSMLRPQVFALQSGEAQIGVAASEKQAIDAMLDSLSAEDPRFWSRADRYWNARGGSHTDGGAFMFSVMPQATNGKGARLVCTDKFGKEIAVDPSKRPLPVAASTAAKGEEARRMAASEENILERLAGGWDYGDVRAYLDSLEAGPPAQAIETLSHLIDARYSTGSMKRSALLSLYDSSLTAVVDGIRRTPTAGFVWTGHGEELPEVAGPETVVAIDARNAPPEGPESLSRMIVDLVQQRGARRLLLANTRGQRFIGCGLSADGKGVTIDVFGSSGDYLGSGLDGVEMIVHGSGQDQLAQIMKAGKLVVHGDVGQTFGYAAKGGDIYILGSAAGRPLINAVGRPHVVINGTALDYLAESFMAGDPLDNGGFAVVNGVSFSENGDLSELAEPYPGGNLFSLASGGALYVRDPRGRLSEDQLNVGEFAPLSPPDWDLIKPYLEENERLFGISVDFLLTVDGSAREPADVYRKIRPSAHHALTPEEAWVHREDQVGK